MDPYDGRKQATLTRVCAQFVHTCDFLSYKYAKPHSLASLTFWLRAWALVNTDWSLSSHKTKQRTIPVRWGISASDTGVTKIDSSHVSTAQSFYTDSTRLEDTPYFTHPFYTQGIRHWGVLVRFCQPDTNTDIPASREPRAKEFSLSETWGHD